MPQHPVSAPQPASPSTLSDVNSTAGCSRKVSPSSPLSSPESCSQLQCRRVAPGLRCMQGWCGRGCVSLRGCMSLRGCSGPRGFLCLLCAASFLQGMTVNGFINTVVTSVERRFQLPGSHSGLIASAYDVASCLCLTFVSYFGGSGHKPRWLGCGVLVLGLGSLLFALPHFTSGPYEATGGGAAICGANQTRCLDSNPGLLGPQMFFVLGQLLHGAGATPLYTLGVTYLDENVASHLVSLYIAAFYTAAILGPAAGYLIGGALLNIYTELGHRTELTPESPLWVGAWWIGFLGAGAAAFFIAVPLLGYPRQLSGSQRYMTMKASEAQRLRDTQQAKVSNPDFGKTLKDLPRSVWLLLRNPPFLLLCLAGAAEATLVAGMSTFGPKFLESQFNLSASEAATLFGYLVVPAGGGGTVLGGFLTSRSKLRGAGLARLCLLCTLTSLLATLAFLLHCPDAPVAGVTISYSGSVLPEGRPELNASCNAGCGCQPELYNPVCAPHGSQNLTFYSPCHAGCPGPAKQDHDGRQVYQDCRCLLHNASSVPSLATAGKCASKCLTKPLLLLTMFIVIFLTFVSSVPALTATLRCVSESQRSFALGIQWIVVRTLGGIPGPMAFGWIIDRACVLWRPGCGRPGSCLLYQNAALSRYMLAAGLAYKMLGLVLLATTCFLYKRPMDLAPHSQSSTSDSPADRQLQSRV